jgi:hypothetical protein
MKLYCYCKQTTGTIFVYCHYTLISLVSRPCQTAARDPFCHGLSQTENYNLRRNIISVDKTSK